MARQRHWVNRGGPGDCIFATTTVLDFVHAFAREEPRTAMREAIIAECRRSKAVLHAFVVMPHHVHLVARMPADRGPTSFMHRLKLCASANVRPLLEPDEAAQFSDQAGLNENQFWQRSFRGKVVGSPGMFHRTIAYVHWNPVRAGYVSLPSEYPWSSAKMWEDGLWHEETGLRI
jgi:putative transposase